MSRAESGNRRLVNICAAAILRKYADFKKVFVNAGYRRHRLCVGGTIALRLLRMSRGDDEKHHEDGENRGFHLLCLPSDGKCSMALNRDNLIAWQA